MRGVYLLHFDRRYEHAGHYTGWAEDIDARLALHERGRGARLLAVVHAAGIGWRLARVWPDADRHKERRLKRSGGASRYCPLCKQEVQTMTDHELASALLGSMMSGLGSLHREAGADTPDFSASEFELPNASTIATTLDVNDGHRYRVTVEVVS